MPGLLLPGMDVDSTVKHAPGLEQVTNGVVHNQDGASATHPDGARGKQEPAGALLTNGHHHDAPTRNGDSAPEPDLALPPELVDMIANNYWSMSTLIERVTQECYNDLNELVSNLESPKLPPTANGASGSAAVQSAGQAAAVSVRKKQLLLEFANGYRHKFIKLMVLLQWGKRSEEIKKLVNVMAWLRERTADFVQSADAFAILKQDLFSFKQPNPDIPTALETLSSATAGWISDLGYIPPEPVSNEEIRRTLHNLDALLSIRINLHEELPRQLRDWDIANGRATFRIPDEFEFDVTIVDEDPAEQFYFLDIRFLFTPAPELPDGAVRVQLGDRADQALKVAGLQGCYDFLHDFVLTYKISVLRKQAHEMSRGAWHGNIRVETVHRSLILQYWTELPRKSWVEIGISSGHPQKPNNSWKGAPTPSLGVRAFRNGVEVSLSGANFDWSTLSMEDILKQVMSQHISYLLGSIEKGLALRDLPHGHGAQQRRLISSPTEPADHSLTIRVRGQRQPFKLLVEPVGGRLLISPPSTLSSFAESELNGLSHPESAGAATLARYPARLLQEHAKAQAAHCDWVVVNDLKVDNAGTKFPQSYLTVTYFRGQCWGRIPWVIAYTVNGGGGSWWAVELAEASIGESIVSAHPILLPEKATYQCVNASLLRSIERRAVDTISVHVLSRQLTALRAGHSLQQERMSTGDCPRLTLLIQAQRLLRAADPTARDFAEGLVRLHVENYQKGSGLVDYLARGTLPSESAKLLSASLSALRDKDVVFAESGPFVLKTSAPLGTSCIGGLTSRLLSLSRVRGALTALKRHKLRTTSVTLAKISFEYTAAGAGLASVTYDAHIEFSSSGSTDPPISTKYLPNTNPHRRVQQQLTQLLNANMERAASSAWNIWVTSLLMSLPVLRALDLIEGRELQPDPSKGSQQPAGLVVHARKLDWYRLDYRNKHLTLDVRLRRSRDRLVWMIEGAKPPRQPPQAPQTSSSLAEALKQAWSERGAGWRGLTSCIEASMTGVEEAILRIDQVVRDESVSSAVGNQKAVAGATGGAIGASSKGIQKQGHDVVDLT